MANSIYGNYLTRIDFLIDDFNIDENFIEFVTVLEDNVFARVNFNLAFLFSLNPDVISQHQ